MIRVTDLSMLRINYRGSRTHRTRCLQGLTLSLPEHSGAFPTQILWLEGVGFITRSESPTAGLVQARSPQPWSFQLASAVTHITCQAAVQSSWLFGWQVSWPQAQMMQPVHSRNRWARPRFTTTMFPLVEWVRCNSVKQVTQSQMGSRMEE